MNIKLRLRADKRTKNVQNEIEAQMNQDSKIKFQIKKYSSVTMKSSLLISMVSEENKGTNIPQQTELEHWLKKKNDLLKKDGHFLASTNKSYIFRHSEFGNSTLVLLGLGKEESFTLESVRQAAAEVYKIAASEKVFDELKYSAYNNKILREFVRENGINKNISLHCGRHSYASLQISLGTDIFTISKMLGHSSIKTTQIYTKILDKNKIQAAAKIPELFF